MRRAHRLKPGAGRRPLHLHAVLSGYMAFRTLTALLAEIEHRVPRSSPRRRLATAQRINLRYALTVPRQQRYHRRCPTVRRAERQASLLLQ